jgi:hypothetical protein
MRRRSICCNTSMCFELAPRRNFWRSYGHLKNSSLISLYGDCTRSQICHDKTIVRSKTDLGNKFLNPENRLIVFSSSSSTQRHTSTRSCYNIYGWERVLPIIPKLTVWPVEVDNLFVVVLLLPATSKLRCNRSGYYSSTAVYMLVLNLVSGYGRMWVY